MTLKEAASESGLSAWTIMNAAKADQFAAEKPRGSRGGWVIDPQSFRDWLLRRRLKGANGPARAAIKRGAMMLAACAILSGCQATIPLGEGGQYGEIFVGYRPPASASVYGVNLSNPPIFKGK